MKFFVILALLFMSVSFADGFTKGAAKAFTNLFRKKPALPRNYHDGRIVPRVPRPRPSDARPSLPSDPSNPVKPSIPGQVIKTGKSIATAAGTAAVSGAVLVGVQAAAESLLNAKSSDLENGTQEQMGHKTEMESTVNGEAKHDEDLMEYEENENEDKKEDWEDEQEPDVERYDEWEDEDDDQENKMEKALRYANWLARYIYYTARKNANKNSSAEFASAYKNSDVVVGSWVLTLRPRYPVASDIPPNETSFTDSTGYSSGSDPTVSSTQNPQPTTSSLPSTATTLPGTTSTAGSLSSTPDLRLVIGLSVVACFLFVALISVGCVCICKHKQQISELKRQKAEDHQDRNSIDSYNL